ncbi:hypothetical protein Gpo141_00013311 [Globisporangium polare]
MAPFSTSTDQAAAAAGDDEASYAFLKPPSRSLHAAAGSRRRRQSSQTSHRLDKFRSLLGTIASVLLVAAVSVYVFGQLALSTPIYSEYLRGIIAAWWDVPGPDGHFEMIVPTYFTLLGVIPVLLSMLLVEFIRHLNLRRLSSAFIVRTVAFLRCKPRVSANRICCFSFGELLFLAFLVGGNVCVFYYRVVPRLQLAHEAAQRLQLTDAAAKMPLPFERYLKIFGVALGLNCMFNMAFLFLPATRNCAWMEVLNISYANGIKYHRWLGILTVLTAVGHGAAFYWAYLLEGTWRDKCLPCFDCDLDAPKGRRVWLNVFGELALLIFVVIGITSIPWVRRKMYNLFYYVHQLFVLSVVFLVMHWEPSIWWLVPTFALYVISRSLSSANSFTPVQVKEFTTLDHDIVKIVINRSAGRDGDYKVGQFVYLNVPSVSKLQWHAFTIGSSPRTSATSLTILLKSLGDWTKDLVEYSEECKRNSVLPTVFVDGYYGASLEMYDEYPTLCLVGGGISVTPLFAILENLVAKLSHHESVRHRRLTEVFELIRVLHLSL